ncbi:DUF305 domain-containing protein [Cetobacterium sp.]|uniref:DUF305 domain-containing protein n=1 Tax=Cetobacterium sp. TaxID=2071632 RepID=UPI0025E39F55|nr:DUF305 domain-containing protein [uncultured Cetobacterium sp.]
MIDFKNINIMVGIAALFSTVSINSYGDGVKEISKIQKERKYRLESEEKIYSVLTPIEKVVPENFRGYKEYDEYAHSLMMSTSSQIFLTNDVGNNFVIYMIPHHEAAIVSSIGVLKYTVDGKIKELAERIIEVQKKEVEMMQTLLEEGELRGNENTEFLKKIQNINMEKMNVDFYNSLGNNSEDISEYYLRSMIPHHEIALEMAKEYLKYGSNQELIKLAQKILLAQEEEIKEIEILLKNREKAGG